MADAKLRVLSDMCVLPGAALESRVDHLRRTVFPHPLSYGTSQSGEFFEFPPAMRTVLEDVARFEQACCTDLVWSVAESGERVRLTVGGLPRGLSLLGILAPE